ncbi:MAG TPA: hypothetical protein VKE95_02660 [Burkholderiales bacterium]|nr:hypothetical protein [Burkholderiales bacterium]
MIPAFGSGNFSNIKVQRGALIEYANTPTPLTLSFEFNPASISRTRAITVRTGGAPGTRGGYDFKDVSQAARAAQGVSVNAESFTAKILLDATDRMSAGDPIAAKYGVQPEIDVLRTMVEPKTQTREGARTLAALGEGNPRAFSRDEYASVLLFVWGVQTLPVFLTQVQVEAKEYLPQLLPYRAEATLTMQIIESDNPFYREEIKRQLALAGQAPPGGQPLGGGVP